MRDIVNFVLRLLTKAPRFLFAVFVVALVLLLPCHDDADRFGIARFERGWRPGLVVVLLLSFALWAVQAVPWARRLRQQRRDQQAFEDSLASLSENEQIVLAYCYWCKQGTVTMSDIHPTAVALASKGILLRPSVPYEADRCPFTLSPLVWRHLCKHPERILPTDLCKPEFKDGIIDAFLELQADETDYVPDQGFW